MSVMKSIPFALMICAGVLSAGRGTTQVMSPSFGVPFKEGVKVEINGHGPYRFGLDLGSSLAFVIVPELSQQLNLPVTSKTHMHGFEENGVKDPEVDVLRIDDLQVAGHLFHHSIGVAFANASPTVPNGSGTLGIGLFQNVVIKLDYPADKLTVFDEPLPVEDGKDVLKYNDVHLRPFVAISVGGVTTDACVDTGARGMGTDISIPAQLATRLRLINVSRSPGVVKDITGQSREFSTATLDGDLIVGNTVVHNPSLSISDAVPYVLLGGILNRTVITLDPKNHRARLQIAERLMRSETSAVSYSINNVP